MLRCFNDCFAVLGLFAAIYCYQRKYWHWGSFFYTTGLNVKMSLLLPLPAMGIMFLQALGSGEALTQAMIIVQVSVREPNIQSPLRMQNEEIKRMAESMLIHLQVAYGYPFRKRAPSYFARAFELTRQFLYKWTVNWRFVPESTFLSKPFALGLLAAHAALLLWFARTRWIKPARRQPRAFLRMIRDEPRDQDQIARRITPDFIMTAMLSAVAIGMLCARSLHYQFYAYLAWTTPFLLWKAGFHPVVQYALWAAQEWAWNVYPSTPLSSATVVGVLATTVVGVWYGTRGEFDDVETNGKAVDGHPHAE